MDVWLIWLVVAVALGIAEIFTLTAALGRGRGAALITAVFAMTGLPPVFSVRGVRGAATAGLGVVRPVLLRRMCQPRNQLFGVDALIGRRA